MEESKQHSAHMRLINVLFLTMMSLLLGVMIITTIRTNAAQTTQAQNSNQELIDYIQKQEMESAQLEQQIIATREAIDGIHEEYSESESLLNTLNNSLAKLNLLAGYVAVEGPGIIITLDDNSVGAELAKKNNPVGYNAENYIVHDKDLLYLIKALAAADAISINGIRIVDSSSIRCVGTVIMVNSARVAPPYEILLIGDADRLLADLYSSSRYIALTYKEIPIVATTAAKIIIPAYTGSYSANYINLVHTDATDADRLK
ncbi:MAG: DUF881 domain-containing protein [Clostridiales bacterium]